MILNYFRTRVKALLLKEIEYKEKYSLDDLTKLLIDKARNFSQTVETEKSSVEFVRTEKEDLIIQQKKSGKN